MKVLRVLLILLIPAMGIVGCKKSDNKPCSKVTKEAEANSTSGVDANQASKKTTMEDNSNPSGSDIYVSGDDDRDGGDKKTKKR